MANPHKGEVSFSANGKTYTLRFSTDAICTAEEALDMGILAIADEMQSWRKSPDRIRMKIIRALFWAGLRDNHPDIELVHAGDLMIAAGGMLKVSELIAEAFSRAFPSAETKGARPPKGKKRSENTTGP